MVDFPLRAVVTATTAQAERSIENVGKKVSGLADTSEASSQKQTSSWGRVGATIAGVTAVAGGLVASMVAASPELAAALSEIKFKFEEVANALGNELAPFVEAFLPHIENLTNWFKDLPQPVKQFTALAIALTAVVGGLALAIGILMTVSLPIIALIVGIAAAIAAVIVIFQNWGAIVDTVTNTFQTRIEEMKTFLGIFKEVFIKTWQGIKDFFGSVWDSIVNIATSGWEILVGLWQSTVTVFETIVDAIIAPFKAAWNMIAEFINNTIIAFVNNALIPAVNVVLPKRWELSPIGGLPTFLTGGIVPGSGSQLIEAHGGEEVLQLGDPRHRRNRGSGAVNMGGVTVIQHFKFGSDRNRSQIMRDVESGTRRGVQNLQRYIRSGYSA